MLKKWMSDPTLVDHKSLSCVVVWIIWITQNTIMFEGKSFSFSPIMLWKTSRGEKEKDLP
jgi:hypothetical protein